MVTTQNIVSKYLFQLDSVLWLLPKISYLNIYFSWTVFYGYYPNFRPKTNILMYV